MIWNCNVLPWDWRKPVLQVVTPPSVEPLSLAEAKSQARVDADMDLDDVDIQRAITAAREFCESRKGAAFVEQTLDYFLPGFPDGWSAIELPRATPLQSITSVSYRDSTGTWADWSSSNYFADTSGTPGMLVMTEGATVPSFTAAPTNAVRIRYVAGALVSSPMVPFPSAIVLAMKQLVAHWYRNREATVVGFQHAEEMALMVDSLLGVGPTIYTC